LCSFLWAARVALRVRRSIHESRIHGPYVIRNEKLTYI
jgi:hypothetical protein